MGRDHGAAGRSVIASRERSWGRALLLMFGPPVAPFGWAMVSSWIGRRPSEGPYVIAVALAVIVLGLHLMPARWWARVAVAVLFLPVIVLVWSVAALLVGYRLFGTACS